MGTDQDYVDPGSVIVRTFTDPSAGTASGRCIVTADGRVWRENPFFCAYLSTGTITGRRERNTIRRTN